MSDTDKPKSIEEQINHPDPTILTTQQLQREIGLLREIIDSRILGMLNEIKHLDVDQSGLQATLMMNINRLQELHEEKFRSISVQFAERDTRTEQTSRDSKVAVDAALQAAKEAVGEQNKSSALAIAKSETATTKQIDQQSLQIATATGALNDKIDDIKDRITAIEGRSNAYEGKSDGHNTGVKDSWSVMTAIVMGVLALVGAAIAVITLIVHK